MSLVYSLLNFYICTEPHRTTAKIQSMSVAPEDSLGPFHSILPPGGTADLSPCVSFACFWTAHAWTTRFEVLYVCLLLLNMMSVWSIHVVALLLVRSFIFIAGMYSTAWIDNNIFIGFLVGENLGCSSSWQMCVSSGGHTHVSWVYV